MLFRSRPLLKSISAEKIEDFPILLIDEIDRADPPFEAFLLELLSDWQITIPEIGTIQAKEPPIVIITSNRTREIHDALKRRCLYHFVDYPDVEQELKILKSRVPNINEELSKSIIHFVKEIRKIEIKTSIKVKYKPILLGGLHNLHGIKAPAFIPAKAKHMIRDCKLIAEKNNVRFKFNSYFPIRSLNLMRGVLVAEEDNIKNYYIDSIFNTIWQDGLNMNDEIIIEKVLKNLEKRKLNKF